MLAKKVRIVLIAIFLALVGASAEAGTGRSPHSPKFDYAFWFKAASEALDDERYEEAISAADEAIRLEPTAEIYCVRASAYAETGDFANSIADCNVVFEKDADRECRLSAYTTRAHCDVEIGDFRKACDDSNGALQLDKENTIALAVRALASSKLGRFDQAIDDCDRLIRQTPKVGALYAMRSTCWEGKQDFNKAIADMGTAIELEPQESSYYFHRAADYNRVAQYAKALPDYERAAELERDDDSATAALAVFLATCPQKDLRNHDRAVILAMVLCAEFQWRESHRISLLASIYAEAGDFPHAIEMQERAVRVADKDDLADCKERLQLFKDGKVVLSADRSLWGFILSRLR